MKILVTGASGFIGSHVARALSEAGHLVTGTYLTQSPWMPWPIQMIQVDLTDVSAVQQMVQTSKPEAVVYCASRHKGGTPLERIHNRVEALRPICNATLDIPFLYLSSRKVITDPASDYAEAQRQCEAIVTSHGGACIRLPAIYSLGRRPWLGAVAWLFPYGVRSVQQVTTDVVQWTSQGKSI